MFYYVYMYVHMNMWWQVLSVGSSVRFVDSGGEQRLAVVLKHFQDKDQSLVIDRKTRKRKMVRTHIT